MTGSSTVRPTPRIVPSTCARPALRQAREAADGGALAGRHPVGDDGGQRGLVGVQRELRQAPPGDQHGHAAAHAEQQQSGGRGDGPADQVRAAAAQGAAGAVTQRAEDGVGEQADQRAHAEDQGEVRLLVRLVQRDELLPDQHLPGRVEGHPHR
nr:hypothetical protein [Deinococcus daejeonensis]